MKKNNINFFSIVKNLYVKIKNANIDSLFIFLFKIKNKINLILKLYLIISLLKTNNLTFTSILDFSDLVLKIIEEESKDIKLDEMTAKLEQLKIELPKEILLDSKM